MKKIMKTRQKTNVRLLSLIFLMALMTTANLQAQVTIGQDVPPAATLDVRAFKTDGTTAEGVIVPRLTKAQINAKQGQYGAAQTGATVYITDYSGTSIPNYSDQIGCIGFTYFNGSNWVMDCTSVSYAKITAQPKSFTFYEQGTETPAALTVSASGSSTLTYQWHKITGSNIHVRISEPCTATDGSGFNTASFTPASVIKGTTRVAANAGFYRYFVRVTNATGDVAESDLAEVAVGCGAKDLNGEWVSFMCFNLGATRQTISAQQTTSVPFSIANDNGLHVKAANEELTYGDLFQWGRIADGHEKRNLIQIGSNGSGPSDNQVAWNTASPPTYENGNVLGTDGQNFPWQQVSRTSTTYYGKFIRTISTAPNNDNWYVGTSFNSDRLWRDNAFAANDPCLKVKNDGTFPSGSATGPGTWYPAASTSTVDGSSGTGWRLPTQAEWASLFRGGTSAGSYTVALANTWDWYQLSSSATEGAKGYAIKPDGVTTTLFLPASGYRTYGVAMLYQQGTYGYYWSGSVAGTGDSSYGLSINNSTINPAAICIRGYAFTLRCIKN